MCRRCSFASKSSSCRSFVATIYRIAHPLLQVHDGMFRIHPTARIDHQRAGPIPARAEPALHAFDKVNVFFHGGCPILLRELSNLFIVNSTDRVPASPDDHMTRIDCAPVIGVQNIARIDLERKHRPQEPAGIFVLMRKARIDVIGHILEVLTFGCVSQTLALRLNVVGFRLDHPIREGRMV